MNEKDVKRYAVDAMNNLAKENVRLHELLDGHKAKIVMQASDIERLRSKLERLKAIEEAARDFYGLHGEPDDCQCSGTYRCVECKLSDALAAE